MTLRWLALLLAAFLLAPLLIAGAAALWVLCWLLDRLSWLQEAVDDETTPKAPMRMVK